jgi:hypothetical protein
MIFFPTSYLDYSQIIINHLLDKGHFSSITKNLKTLHFINNNIQFLYICNWHMYKNVGFILYLVIEWS